MRFPLFLPILALPLILASGAARGDVTLAPIFTDHAVLQQEKTVPIWGQAKAGEKVTVDFLGQHVSAKAGRDGRWIAWLAPVSAGTAGADLIVTAGNRIALHDVVVGEVWLCAGGSNLEVPPSREDAAAARLPFIRQFTIAPVLSAVAEQSLDGAWVPSAPETAGRFSAAGYAFARDLQRKLGVPVGLIVAAYPGAPLGAWGASGNAFQGMIDPVVPYAIRGALWDPPGAGPRSPAEYLSRFSAMIADWRTRFAQGNLPFYWMQLPGEKNAADPNGEDRAWVRAAQAQALDLPATGQAVTIDLGSPTDVREGGRRLALIAKAEAYGFPGDDSGPVFAGISRDGAALRVKFKHAENGLTAADKPLQSFEVAGADRKFHPASATIDGGTLLVKSPQVPEPVAVRYAWQNSPEANLFNGAGLPAAPFRSDDWPAERP